MSTRFGLAGVLVAALATPVLAGELVAADAQVWNSYVNERFGVTADVPSIGFVANEPPMNGDGQSWRGGPDDQVTVAVFGNYWTASELDFDGYRDQMRGFLVDGGAEITYEPEGATWFVFSGFLDDGRIFYERTEIVAGCDIAGNIHLEYPQTERAAMDGIVSRMASTLAHMPEACG